MEDHARGGAVKPPKPPPAKYTLVATLASGEEVELGTGLLGAQATSKIDETFRKGVTVNDEADGSTRFVAASQVVEILRTTDEVPAPPTP